MTVDVEQTRAGLLGAVADEIERLRAAQRDLEEQTQAQIAQIADALDGGTREVVVVTLRRQTVVQEAQLRRALDAEQQRRGDLLAERRSLTRQAGELRAWLAENAERAQRLERAQELLREARNLLDRSVDWDALDHLSRTPIQFPQRYAQTRAQLVSVERRLDELGEE